jgi:hypothetical protein
MLGIVLGHDAPLPVLRCPWIAHKIRVDGDVHKAPWSAIEPVWLQPSDGRSPGPPLAPAEALRHLAPDAPPLDPSIRFQPTAVRLARSATHLYVAFQCVDRDVWGSFRGRNEPIYEEEVVEMFLAPGDDPGRYVELETSPRGAWFEALVTSPDRRRATMRVDTDWRCTGWERGVRVRGTLDRRDDLDAWWSVEWAVPFAALPGGRAPAPGERWRGNFFRIDAADGGQFSAWSPTFAAPPDFHLPDLFGVIEFA